MAMYEVQETKALEPTKTWQRPLAVQKGAAIATAQTFYIDLPRDHFIHEILIQVSEHATDPDSTGLVDKIASLQVVGNGNKYLKDMIGDMSINVQRMNGQRHLTGYYHLFFSDPKIDEAKPLPSWVFTSLQLIITDTAPAATLYRWIYVTLVESAYKGEDLSDWKILIEKYLAWRKYGNNTGEQEYEHERAYKIYSYLYAQDEGGTLTADIYNKLRLLGRKPQGEVTIVGSVTTKTLVNENNARQLENLGTGFFYLEWRGGFPSTEFSSLKSYLNKTAAGTNTGMRVLERYVL